MNYPDVTTADWFAEKFKASKEMIDAAIESHEGSDRKKIYQKRYNSFNGIYSDQDIKDIVRKYVDKSKTPFVPYQLGKTKIQRLLGEFLRIGLSPTVYTYNYEATEKKQQELNVKRGKAIAKPTIEAMREKGIDPYEGAEIPGMEEPGIFDETNYKTINERIMQKIITHKVRSEDLKTIFKNALKEAIIQDEVCIASHKDSKGYDRLRIVNQVLKIVPHVTGVTDSEEYPFMGEKRLMTLQQMLSLDGVTDDDAKEIKKYFQESNDEQTSDGLSLVDDEVRGIKRERYTSGLVNSSDGSISRWVYIVEWKAFSDRIFKEEGGFFRELTEKEYKANKRKTNAEFYEVSNKIKMKGYKLGNDLYFGIHESVNCAVIENANGKLEPLYDYKNFVFDETDGVTISMQDVISKIEFQYDILRWQFNREIRKLNGKASIIDDAFRSKPFYKMLFELSDDGVTTMNSQKDQQLMNGNQGLKGMIETVDFGGSQLITEIINAGADLERILDNLTGFNDARQGLEKATTTATTNQNNLESSRSATYPLFDFIDHIENVMISHLANKVKINDDYIRNIARGAILTSRESNFLENSEDMMFDSYGAYVANSKKELSVRSTIEAYIPQEINAGKLSTVDFARYALKETLSEAVEVLDKGRKRIESIEAKNAEQANQVKREEIQARKDMALENREDMQAAKLDEIALTKDLELRNKALEANVEGSNDMIRENEITRRTLAVAKINANSKPKTTSK